MSDAKRRSEEQQALWNGAGARGWVELQDVLESVLKPFEELLAEAVSPATGRVLDVGCGTGDTTLAFARRLGPRGRVTGVDISEPMLAVARSRTHRERAPATFVLADAQTHAFEAASFDLVASRFGVVFFADAVAAFANLRRATKEGGELRFVTWRSADENPFMTAAERVAAPFLSDLPARRPGEPGQFAFAARDHVHSILESSGWSGIDIAPVDVPCTMPEAELIRYASSMGPVGRALQRTEDGALRARAIEMMRAAFASYVQGSAVRFVGACWLVRARA